MVGLSCPRCNKQLNSQTDKSYVCDACRVNFPLLPQSEPATALPFIWAEPGAALLDWRNRYNMALADLEVQLANTKATQHTLPSSQQRLEQMHTALTSHQDELNNLLQPLQVGQALAKELHLALRTKLPSHHGVLSYAQNIHRDWCWGDDENTQVLEHLCTALGDGANPPPQSMLVLGCGAGRLAYDLHRQLEVEESWALDSNPLLCLIGSRMAAGDAISFTEFPLAPRTLTDAAISRTLQAPEAIQGLNFVCADALRAPFAAEQFDLVVTPWLLDVIDAGLGEMINVVANLLKPGGTWLNHGSVAFGGASANRLTASELAELTATSGFEVVHAEDHMLPYLQSPASRQQRKELTYTQVAQRTDAPIPARQKSHQHLPDWIVTGKSPIPLSNGFQTQITTTRIHAFIMSLIDGKRSIQDMAKILEEQRLMPAADATQAIRQFLIAMQEEAIQLEGRPGV